MILRPRIRQPDKIRNSLLRPACLPRVRHAHGWTPSASTYSNETSRLGFFDSYHASRCKDDSLVVHPHSQALYGQLVVSALLQSTHTQVASSSNEEPSNSQPERTPNSPTEGEISDQEWDIRTGRAIYILQQTLPDYFSTGLVSSLDIPNVRPETGVATPTGSWSLKNVLGLTNNSDGVNTAPKAKDETDTGSIYSPRVRLTYTPPTPLPAPFPKTLHVEGLHLYIASSVFLRHTLNALYTDLHMELRRVRVQGLPPTENSSDDRKRRKSREKCFVVNMAIIGTGRVSKAPAQWDVNCTYSFSPISGQIIQHSIDSIEPAPTQALFEALGKFGLLGSGNSRGIGGAGGVGQ